MKYLFVGFLVLIGSLSYGQEINQNEFDRMSTCVNTVDTSVILTGGGDSLYATQGWAGRTDEAHGFRVVKRVNGEPIISVEMYPAWDSMGDFMERHKKETGAHIINWLNREVVVVESSDSFDVGLYMLNSADPESGAVLKIFISYTRDVLTDSEWCEVFGMIGQRVRTL